MKKIAYLVLVMTVLLLISCSSGKSVSLLQFNRLNDYPIKKIIGIYGYLPYNDFMQLGIVTENRIRFFNWEFSGDNWNEDTDMTFYLPSNCRDVFYVGGGIGIVTEDKVIFYRLLDSVWQERPELMFTLPGNCQGIFAPTHVDRLFAIVENKICFYLFDGDTWKEIPEYELELPNDSRGAFSNEWGEIFVIGNNSIKIFSNESSEDNINVEWLEITEFEFDLPANFRGAFFCDYLGIIDDNEIKFYMSVLPDDEFQYPGGWVRVGLPDLIIK